MKRRLDKSTPFTPARSFPRAAIALISFAVALSAAAEAFAQGDDMNRAKELFTTGQAAFEAGRYDEAQKAFEESLAAFPHFRTLFNIGLCAEKLGDTPKAIAMYQRYVDWPSEVPNREDVAKKVEELEATLPPEPKTPSEDSDEPATTPEHTPPPSGAPSDGRGRDLRIPGWIAVGTGAAGMIVGGVFLGLANGKKKEMEEIDGEPYDPATHDAIIDDGERDEKIGWIAGGAGLAVAVTGAILLLVSRSGSSPRDGAASSREARLVVTPIATSERAAIDVQWRF